MLIFCELSLIRHIIWLSYIHDLKVISETKCYSNIIIPYIPKKKNTNNAVWHLPDCVVANADILVRRLPADSHPKEPAFTGALSQARSSPANKTFRYKKDAAASG